MIMKSKLFIIIKNARIAQSVEQRADNAEVAGSNPAVSTNISGISSVWLERVIWDHEAVGLSPTSPTSIFIMKGGS